MDPIDTSVLPVSVQQAMQGLPAQMSAAPQSSADLWASLFAGDAATVDLSPAAQALIDNESANEQIVTDAAQAIGLTDWSPAER